MSKNETNISPATKAALDLLERKLNLRGTYQRIFDRLLDDGERRRVERSKTIGPSIVDIWSKIKRVPRAQAIVELAWKVEAATLAECNGLAQYLGMKPIQSQRRVSPTETVKPVYRDGVLVYCGVEIRSVKQSQPTSRVQMILQEFQNRDWPRTIDVPWKNAADDESIRNAVYVLNRGMKRPAAIKFTVRMKCKIGWSENM